jgi:caspase domain-containing protein
MICPLLGFGFAFIHGASVRGNRQVQTRSSAVSAPVSPQTGPRRGKDYALVIGVGAYAHFPRLSNPVDDARGIAKSLHEVYGFKVTLLENPTRAQIFDSIDDFSYSSPATATTTRT